MGNRDEVVVSRLRDEVLNYLRNHPQAADTVTGIARWWLPQQHDEAALTSVQQALDELATQGLVIKTMLADGTILYTNPEPPAGAKH
jgi:Fe2+ or Zn2+ uptake regulation protein